MPHERTPDWNQSVAREGLDAVPLPQEGRRLPLTLLSPDQSRYRKLANFHIGKCVNRDLDSGYENSSIEVNASSEEPWEIAGLSPSLRCGSFPLALALQSRP